MKLEVYTPTNALKEFIDSIIFLSGGGTGVAFPRMYQTIIINIGNNFTVSDIYTPALPQKETTSTIWINGKQEIPFMLGNAGLTAMYVIGLKPGMLPYLAGLPAIETNEQALGAENWAPAEMAYLREQLLECTSIHAGFLLIEKFLVHLLRQKEFHAVEKVKWLGNAMHTHRVEEICRELGITRKRLRSDSQYYFGGSVKQLQGLIRFNHTLADIATHCNKPLSALHHYYDQAHFINDFKARSGITPLQYKRLCQQFPAIKYTPNFISLSRETFLQFINAGSR